MKIKYIYICMYLPISLLVSRCPDAAAGGEQSVQCTVYRTDYYSIDH
jgi:hypothetical protein